MYTNYTENASFWLSASKAEKRKFNLKRFEDDLRTNLAVRGHYREAKKEKCIAWYCSEEDEWKRSDKYNGSKGVVGWRPIYNRRHEKIDYSDEAEARNWAAAEHKARLRAQMPNKPSSEMNLFEQHLARRCQP